MAFPTTSVLDDFTGTGSLSANWTLDVEANSGTGANRTSDQLATSRAGVSTAWWNATTFGPDCEAFLTIATKAGNGRYEGLWLRLQTPGTTGVDGYFFEVGEVAGTDQCTIYRQDDHIFTVLTGSFSQEFSAGDALGAEAIGSTLTIYRKASGGAWSSIGSRSDATYGSAGNIGVYIENTTGRFDDFGGGDVVTAGATVRLLASTGAGT